VRIYLLPLLASALSGVSAIFEKLSVAPPPQQRPPWRLLSTWSI
jgi:hypothetical protein